MTVTMSVTLTYSKRFALSIGSSLIAGFLFGALFHLTTPWAIGIKLFCLAGLVAVVLQAHTTLRAALIGLAWGWGAHLTGMGWLFVAMHEVGGMPAPLAGLGLALLAALLAAFTAFSTGLAKSLDLRGLGTALPFAAAWVLGEWLRSWVLTGLPWVSVGYGFLDSGFVGAASSLGVLGVGGAAVLGAVCVVYLFQSRRLKAVLGGSALLIACHFAGQQSYTSAFEKPLSVALLQGNVPQNLKFDRELSQRHMMDYALQAAGRSEQLIVMPETALPTTWENLPAETKTIMQSVKSTLLVGSIGVNKAGLYTNRLSTPFAKDAWQYDKTHLVPFGELIPWGFQWFVDSMNMPLSSMGVGESTQANLSVNGVAITANICYEELFAHEWRLASHSANVLLNASNFGWYGKSTALPQHANIARMRALEFQKPYLSATNNGTTLHVLPTGAVAASLPDHESGVLSASVQGMAGVTPYARWGDWGASMLAVFTLLYAAVRRRR